MPLIDVGESEKFTCDTGKHRHLYLEGRDLRLVDSVTVCPECPYRYSGHQKSGFPVVSAR